MNQFFPEPSFGISRNTFNFPGRGQTAQASRPDPLREPVPTSAPIRFVTVTNFPHAPHPAERITAAANFKLILGKRPSQRVFNRGQTDHLRR